MTPTSGYEAIKKTSYCSLSSFAATCSPNRETQLSKKAAVWEMRDIIFAKFKPICNQLEIFINHYFSCAFEICQKTN